MCMPFKMQELEQDMKQLININLGKVSNKTAYYQSYVKYMQTLLFKMPLKFYPLTTSTASSLVQAW